MNKKQTTRLIFEKELEEHENWLRTIIAPDDIYSFACESLKSATKILLELSNHIDVIEEINKNTVLGMSLQNISTMHIMYENKMNGKISMKIKKADE
ncbi:MAG: hypothetical protein Q8876_05640 [Bacillota bacterium]|nr:hypothetical protein [Bacillota bacterium]